MAKSRCSIRKGGRISSCCSGASIWPKRARLPDLYARFRRDCSLSTSCTSPDKALPKEVVWTQPELVCEVRFANWTEEGRLRAPVFLGLRPDKRPDECVRENGEANGGRGGDPAAARDPLIEASAKEAMLTID